MDRAFGVFISIRREATTFNTVKILELSDFRIYWVLKTFSGAGIRDVDLHAYVEDQLD